MKALLNLTLNIRIGGLAGTQDQEVKGDLTEARRVLSESLPGFAEALKNELQGLDSWDCLPRARYQGKDVLDLGCGLGASSTIFVERGANFVWAIDPVLTEEQIRLLSVLPRARFTSAWLSPELFDGYRFDLVYARFVTEHLMDLPAALATLFDLLKPGGSFVALHDNYYSPMGAHDQPFIGPAADASLTYQSKAVRCWDAAEKCTASTEFREEVGTKYDWTVKQFVLTPYDCTQCPYFHRAQLWGHIRYQDSFTQNYPGAFFKTNRAGSLNKVTPFQLRQFLVEAGFKITAWEPVMITNDPPVELKQVFNEHDLRTAMILFAADKPA